MAGQPPVARHGDGAGFLADDQRNGVGRFGYAEGRAVTGAQLTADALAVAEAEDAGGRHDARPADDHSAVMQGRIGLKDVFQQRGGDLRIERGARLDDVLEADALLDDDQRAHAAAAEGEQAAGDFVDDVAAFLQVGGNGRLVNGAASQLLQRLAKLGLKQDHQHHRAVVDHVEQYPVKRRQPQKIAYPAGHHQRDQPLENGAGARFLGEHEQLIEQKGHNEDVQHVGDGGAVEHVPKHGLDLCPQGLHRFPSLPR